MPNRLKTSTLSLFLLVLVCLNTFGRAPAEHDCGTDEYKASIERYTKAIQFSKYDYFAYVGRGRAYLGLGDHDAALKDFNRAMEIQPKGDAAYHERGLLYYERSNMERAISDLTRAIELDPFNSRAYCDRARSRWNGDKDLVIPDLTKAIELSPDDYLFVGARGAALLKGGMKQQAILDLNRAFEMITSEIDKGEKTPCEGEAYIKRGYIAVSLQRLPDAIKDFDTAIRLNPADFEGYPYRAIILVFQHKYREALADLDKAIELNPNHADVYESRAKVYDKLNQKEKAAADRLKYQTLSTSTPNM
jgi:tetratricopeptide (TPR) repeat protein